MHTSVSWLLSLSKVDRRAALKDYSINTLENIHMLAKSEIRFNDVDWPKMLFIYIFTCLFMTPIVFLINVLQFTQILYWQVYAFNALYHFCGVIWQVRTYRKVIDLNLDIATVYAEKS